MSCTKTIKSFEQINSFKTLIYLGKRKIYEKILDMILFRVKWTLIYYGKNYGTIVNYNKL